MDAERRPRIQALYDAARERPAEERSAFLAEACQGDDELRREVESLLGGSAADPVALGPPAHETIPCLTTPPRRTVLAAGAHLGPYKILGLLGAGGIGEVYDALDPRLDRHVALKVLRESALVAGLQSRFVREARATASVSHPNIAHVYEIAEAGTTCYIAMEFIEGVTLRQKLSAPDTTLAQLLEYLRQTANALARAHAKGVVHCDLKPDNIMVTRDGFAKVLDFGLAKLIERYRRAEASGEGEPAAPESKTGLIAGTVGYMSPEQAEGRRGIDERSDVFSFGCMLFEAATRRLPFATESVARTLHNLLYEPTPRIESLGRSAPPALQRIVDRCLEKDPAQRYPNMEEVSRSLAGLLREMEAGPVPAPRDEGGPPAPPPPAPPKPSVLLRWARAAALTALAITAGVIAYRHWRPPDAMASIAVIPFVDAHRTPESEYLAYGISEGVINALAQLPDLKVIARSSSFKFSGEGLDVRRVARLLGVQVLVTGRVAELGGRLRITAELVNGADGTQIWGAQYSAGRSNLALLEAEISREIARRIRSELTPSERARLARVTKAKPEAYELFLRGRYQMQLYAPENRQKALGYYQQALALDPGFALANAELAYCYRMLSGSGIVSAAEAMPQAEAAAGRALAADPNLAEAHAALGDIRKDQWDWTAAEGEYRRALELSPNLAAAHQGYAIFLSVMGRYEEAFAQVQRLLELDPVGLPAAIHAAAVYYNARRYGQALDMLKRAADLDPSSPAPWTWTGIVQGGREQFPAAIAAFEKTAAMGDTRPATECYYAAALVRSGRRDQALKILRRLERTSEFVPPVSLAVVYTALDQKERAIQALEAAYASRDPLLQYIEVESYLDRLKDDPRFQQLATRMGLKR